MKANNTGKWQTILTRPGNYNRLLVIIILCLFVGGNVSGQGNLMIYPKRLLFDGTKKIQQLNLVNSGTDSATYLISVTDMQISDSGRYEFITMPDSTMNTADNNLRIYPRKVTIPPNKAQVVKVQLTNYSQLRPGEYRSHIYFRALPNEHPKATANTAKKDTSGITIQIEAIFGFTIPVIIRNGATEVKMSLGDVSLQNDNEDKWLNFTFNREGNMSAYGELIVNHIGVDGSENQVGYAKGLAVYPPNTKRYCRLKLSNDKDTDYRGGKLHIVYKNLEKNKSDILAEADLELLQ